MLTPINIYRIFFLFLKPGTTCFVSAFLFLITWWLYVLFEINLDQLSTIFNQKNQNTKLVLMAVFTFFENIIVIGWYFPGTSLLLGIVFLTVHTATDLFTLWGASLVGLLLASCFNLLFGRFGLASILIRFRGDQYIETLRKKMILHPNLMMLMAPFHANLLSVYFVCTGVAWQHHNQVAVKRIFCAWLLSAAWLLAWYFAASVGLWNENNSTSAFTWVPYIAPSVLCVAGLLLCVRHAMRNQPQRKTLWPRL